MKKILAAFLAFVLLASLAGCGIAKRDDTPDPPVNININNPEPATTSGPVDPGEEQIERTVICDQDGIRVIVTELDASTYSLEMPDLYFTLENNTSKDLIFSMETCVVNGYSVSAYLYETVSAHSSTDVTAMLDFDYASEESESECICDLILYMEIEDADSYEIIKKIGPEVLYTDAAPDYTYTYDDSGAVVVDDSNFKITLRDLYNDGNGGQYQEVYVQNKTSDMIAVWVENVTINGKECEPGFYLTVAPDSRGFDLIHFYSSIMEETGVTDITELGLAFKVISREDYSTLYESGDLIVTYDE